MCLWGVRLQACPFVQSCIFDKIDNKQINSIHGQGVLYGLYSTALIQPLAGDVLQWIMEQHLRRVLPG